MGRQEAREKGGGGGARLPVFPGGREAALPQFGRRGFGRHLHEGATRQMG